MRKFILILLVLLVIPIGLRAQDSTFGVVNLGAFWDAEAEALGFSIQGMKKLAGGKLQLSAIGSFGEAGSKAAGETGFFLLEGGAIEAALIQGVSNSWTEESSYTAGYSGLLGTYRTPWNWPGYDKPIRFFVKWQRQYPFDKAGAQEPSHEYTVGVSL